MTADDATTTGHEGAEPTGGLARTAAAGAVWSIAQNLLTKVTAFVTVLILARLLSPADFGIVTIASTVIPITQVLADLGITIYILQHRAPTKLIYDTYFWTTSSIAVVGGGILVLIAPFLAQSLGEPAAGPVIQGLVPTALLISLGAVPQTILRRGLKFQTLAVQAAIAAIASQAVAIAAAVLGAGVWALVLQAITAQVIATTLAWATARYRPSFRFSWTELVLMVKFGGHYVVSTGIQTAAQLLVNFIITATLGVTALGYLNIIQRLTRVVTEVVLAAVLQVSTVAFAMIRDSVDRLRSGYLRSFSTMYALLVPLMVFIAASAPHLVPFMYGGQWEASIAPGEILALTAVFLVDALDHALYAGIGRPSLWTIYTCYSSVLIVAATWLGSLGGLQSLVWASLGAYVVSTIVRWFVAARQLDTRGWVVVGRFLQVAVPAACAGAAGYVVALLGAGLPHLAGVIAVGLVVLIVYVPLLRLAARSTWDELVDLARQAGRRLRRRGSAPAA